MGCVAPTACISWRLDTSISSDNAAFDAGKEECCCGRLRRAAAAAAAAAVGQTVTLFLTLAMIAVAHCKLVTMIGANAAGILNVQRYLDVTFFQSSAGEPRLIGPAYPDRFVWT